MVTKKMNFFKNPKKLDVLDFLNHVQLITNAVPLETMTKCVANIQPLFWIMFVMYAKNIVFFFYNESINMITENLDNEFREIFSTQKFLIWPCPYPRCHNLSFRP